MFPRSLHFSKQSLKKFSTSVKFNRKVAILGAASGIGQPLSLLLKLSPLISKLSLYDGEDVTGVKVDLSHIDSISKVQSFSGDRSCCGDAVKSADIVIITAGESLKIGMTNDDCFSINADIIYDFMKPINENAPDAFIAIVTSPITSIIPMAAEVLRSSGNFDPRKLFGVTNIDRIRARTFLSEMKKMSLKGMDVDVPVIGGSCASTIIPLLSQCCPAVELTKEEVEKLTKRIREAGNEVVEAKVGNGSATLSIAHAAAQFTFSLCRALNGEPDIVESAYVESDILDCAKFFSNPLLLGPQGIEENLGFGKLSEYEEDLVKAALPSLYSSLKKGLDFAKKMKNEVNSSIKSN